MARACDTLSKIAPSLRSVRDELDRTQAALSCFPGQTPASAHLRQISVQLEQFTAAAERLSRTLEQAEQTYLYCERLAAEHCNQTEYS